MKVFTILEQLVSAEPFRPFDVLLSGGDRVAVHHPELLIVNREERDFEVHSQTSEFLLSGLHVVGFSFPKGHEN
jgi:hypothetical protein